MNQVQNIFSIPIYFGEVRDKEKINDALLNSMIITENKLRKYETFSGDFYTSYDIETKKSEVWFRDLFDEVMSGLREYVEMITVKGKSLPSEIALSNIWFNVYDRGQYQEVHDHLSYGATSLFSFIYYLKLPKDFPGQTVFVNDGYGKCKGYYSPNLDIAPLIYSPKVVEGQYLIFPSFLSHYVDHHSSEDEQRITVSGNVKLLYEDDPERKKIKKTS